MTVMNQSRASVDFIQLEYTTQSVSNSKAPAFTRQEDKVITHRLNHEELALLIRDNLYQDLSIEPITEQNLSIVSSHDASIFAYLKVYEDTLVMLPKETYKDIIQGSKSFDYSPMVIAGTPEGIFAFNLELLKIGFEPYTDDNGNTYDVAELPLNIGTQIMEWYPEFASEEEYIDTLMSDRVESDTLEDVPMWEDGDEW
jgi:hypothetical protein